MYIRSINTTMSQRLNKTRSAMEKEFAPEANGPFEEVSERQIAEMRDKLEAEYGVGKGRIRSLDNSLVVD